MDLEPFSRINPCGYEGLEVTQLKNLVTDVDINDVVENLQHTLLKNLSYE